MIQTTIFDALDRAKQGMTLAAEHADRVSAGWTDRAHGYLLEYIATHDRAFLIEDVREFAEAKGFEDPPSKKAWGAVAQNAARKKIVCKVGYAPAKSSNGSPKCLWASPLWMKEAA